jgi:very-short-patch-repair endonuclease
MTEAEKRLWRGVQELEVAVRFRRQHPIGMSVVDFAFPTAKLAIELDGGQHAMQGDQDDARTLEIAARGYRVIRFWNSEVMENLAGVLEVIRRELTTSLSAPGGGEGRGEGGVRAAARPTSPSPSLTRRVPSLSALGRRGIFL